MGEYLVRTPFRKNTPQGDQVMNKGEAVRLSSIKAAKYVANGLLVDTHIGLDLLTKFEARVTLLMDKLGYPKERAEAEAMGVVTASLKRHESLKSFRPPTPEFLEGVAEFNRTSNGTNPITKIQSDKGAGEWAGYNCNIGSGCAHGCLYCYAEKIASRYSRIATADEWLEEVSREVSTAKCKKYSEPVMFPTTHDITHAYLPAFRCHLFNILNAGNTVVIVSKPHEESIRAICAEFSSFRDNMTFRFSIGGLDNDDLRIWEPGAPTLVERLKCLRIAFSEGFKTSVSAEPMLGDRVDAEKLYFSVEPFVTEDIWFGKMNNVGGFRKYEDPEIARRASELCNAYNSSEIMKLVASIGGLPKVKWKDSIQEVIVKQACKSRPQTNNNVIEEGQ